MYKYLYFLLVVIFFGCKADILLPSEYIRWLENPENGLVQILTLDSFKISIQYEPIPYIIAREFKSNKINSDKFEARKAALQNSSYYKIVVQMQMPTLPASLAADETAQQELLAYKQQLKDYFTFGMQQSLILVANQDTLLPALFHHESSYQNEGTYTILVAFDKEQVLDNHKIIYNANVLNKGILEIEFLQKNIARLPELRLF